MNVIDQTATGKKPLFLVEFYTKHPQTGETGWDIAFAWVRGEDSENAIKRVEARVNHFDCVIRCDEAAEVAPLGGPFRVNTPDANLFFIGV